MRDKALHARVHIIDPVYIDRVSQCAVIERPPVDDAIVVILELMSDADLYIVVVLTHHIVRGGPSVCRAVVSLSQCFDYFRM